MQDTARLCKEREVIFEIAGVVQLARTTACHAGGRRFESRRSHGQAAHTSALSVRIATSC